MLIRSVTCAKTRPISSGVMGGGVVSLGPFYGVMSNPPAITITDAASTTIPGGLRVPVVGSVLYRHTGTPTIQWTTDNNFVIATDGAGGAAIVTFLSFEFTSTAPQVEFLMVRFNSRFDIRVDNELIQSALFSFDAAGSRRLVKLDWSADANPTKARTYRIAGFNMPFGGLWVTAGGSITYPSERDSVPLMAFMGDSYTMGTGANGPDQTWADTLATALGHEWWGDGLGSSGWNTASPNDPVSRLGKRINVLTDTPAVVVTALGFNDAGGNMTTLAASYDSAIASIQAEYPAATIITIGPWTPVGNTANLTTVANTLSARAAANGVAFVSIDDIVTAENKSMYTGGDNVHPTAEGHKYLGRTIAARVRPAL